MKVSNAVGVGIIGGFVVTIGYSIYVTKTLFDVARKLDTSIDKMVHEKTIEIPESTINKAIEKSVDLEVRYQVTKATEKMASEVVNTYKKDIEKVVDEEFNKQKLDVPKQIKAAIGRIDVEEAKKQIIREAKAEAKEKFHDELEEVVEKHQEQLDDITDIYSTIAEKIKGMGD